MATGVEKCAGGTGAKKCATVTGWKRCGPVPCKTCSECGFGTGTSTITPDGRPLIKICDKFIKGFVVCPNGVSTATSECEGYTFEPSLIANTEDAWCIPYVLGSGFYQKLVGSLNIYNGPVDPGNLFGSTNLYCRISHVGTTQLKIEIFAQLDHADTGGDEFRYVLFTKTINNTDFNCTTFKATAANAAAAACSSEVLNDPDLGNYDSITHTVAAGGSVEVTMCPGVYPCNDRCGMCCTAQDDVIDVAISELATTTGYQPTEAVVAAINSLRDGAGKIRLTCINPVDPGAGNIGPWWAAVKDVAIDPGHGFPALCDVAIWLDCDDAAISDHGEVEWIIGIGLINPGVGVQAWTFSNAWNTTNGIATVAMDCCGFAASTFRDNQYTDVNWGFTHPVTIGMERTSKCCHDEDSPPAAAAECRDGSLTDEEPDCDGVCVEVGI